MGRDLRQDCAPYSSQDPGPMAGKTDWSDSMIFRRVKAHVAKEDWFAVFIDFLIVVAGVFIGLQVSNWSQQQVENARSKTYLERLDNDISLDIGTLKKRIGFWSAVIKEGETAITYAETGERGDKSDWDLIVAFYQASQIWKYSASDTSYAELKGSGELRLIRDKELRSAFAKYYDSLGRRAADLYQLNPEFRTVIRAKTPYPAQTYIWENCHQGDGHNQALLTCPEPDLDIDMSATLESFVTDPKVIESLRFWIINLSVTKSQGVFEIERLQELAAFINDARKKS
jgi:hypothetical protein